MPIYIQQGIHWNQMAPLVGLDLQDTYILAPYCEKFNLRTVRAQVYWAVRYRTTNVVSDPVDF